MELEGCYRAHQQNQHVVFLHYISVLAEDGACGGKAKLRVICVSALRLDWRATTPAAPMSWKCLIETLLGAQFNKQARYKHTNTTTTC